MILLQVADSSKKRRSNCGALLACRYKQARSLRMVRYIANSIADS